MNSCSSLFQLSLLTSLWICSCDQADKGDRLMPPSATKESPAPPQSAPKLSTTLPKLGGSLKAPTVENIDLNKDGIVQKEEFLTFHAQNAEVLFARWDQDRSKTLSPAELRGGPAPNASPAASIPTSRLGAPQIAPSALVRQGQRNAPRSVLIPSQPAAEPGKVPSLTR
jgi:hypothetical protein